MFIGVGEIKKAIKATTLVDDTEKIANKADDIGKIVSKADDAGKIDIKKIEKPEGDGVTIEGGKSKIEISEVKSSTETEKLSKGEKAVGEGTDEILKIKFSNETKVKEVMTNKGLKIEFTNKSGNTIKWIEQNRKNIPSAIESAKKSSNIGKAIEGKVADYINKKVEVTRG